MKIERINKLKNMSFWIWEKSTKCQFSAFENSVVLTKKAKNQSYSKVQITGLLFHELIEAYRKGKIEVKDFESFEKEINLFIAKYSSKYPFQNEDVVGWKEAEDIFDFFVEESRRTQFNSPRTSESYYELEIVDHNRNLLGRPDLIIEKADEYHIIEFKSGNLIKDNLLKNEYVHQLHFYSGLTTNRWGKPPSKIILQSLLDGTKEVRFDLELQERIMNSAAESLIKLNSFLEENDLEILNSQLVSPDLDVCRHCKLRPFCSKFKRVAESFPHDEPIHIVQGTFKVLPAQSHLPFVIIEIETMTGPVSILNVPSKEINEKFLETEIVFLMECGRFLSSHAAKA